MLQIQQGKKIISIHSKRKCGLIFLNCRLLAATTLRNTLGLHTLQEILQEKEAIAHSMQEHLDATTHVWYAHFIFLFIFN